MASPKELSPKERVFVAEYLIDLNAAAAARRAGFSAKTAKEIGYQLLGKPHVQEAIAAAMAERARRAEVTADMVLEHWSELARADPNDVIEYRRGACRYCHGDGHFYHWRDHVEFAEACAKARKRKDSEPTDEGGYGYRHTEPANPECPRCCGEGIGYSYAHPSRNIPARSRALYAGVKEGRDGLEIKVHDPEEAWDKLAKHLGMGKDQVDVNHAGGITITIAGPDADL